MLSIWRIGLDDRREPERLSTSRESRQRSAFKPSVGFCTNHLQKRIVYKRQRSKRKTTTDGIRRDPGSAVDNTDATAGEIFKDDPPRGSEIARQPTQVIDEDTVEFSLFGVSKKHLQLLTLGVRARYRSVTVVGNNVEAAVFGEAAATANLIVNRTGILLVRRVARVSRDAHDALFRRYSAVTALSREFVGWYRHRFFPGLVRSA